MLKEVPAFIRPIYLAVTKLFQGWKDLRLLVARKRPGWQPKSTLPDDELAAILGKGVQIDS